MWQLRTADFTYSLPASLIAQRPIEQRDHSRLLVMDRYGSAIQHRRFSELPQYLRAGDLLVFNDSRVMPARLRGHRVGTGGQVELLLLRREAPRRWWCLARPARSLRPSAELLFPDGLQARILKMGERGVRLVELSDEGLAEKVGEVPLPPYIHEVLSDSERYQTVYAKVQGSIAAPTAGLHFTPKLFAELQSIGVEVAFVTLHVGLDTFRPVEVEDPYEHQMHTEYFELSEQVSGVVNKAKADGRRVIAVGTTTVRVLEQAALFSEASGNSGLRSGSGFASLFILPGHHFRVVDAMVTNFHLPRSSLLMLVSAFAGRERILAAYREAIESKYRFYSFGDSMFIS